MCIRASAAIPPPGTQLPSQPLARCKFILQNLPLCYCYLAWVQTAPVVQLFQETQILPEDLHWHSVLSLYKDMNVVIKYYILDPDNGWRYFVVTVRVYVLGIVYDVSIKMDTPNVMVWRDLARRLSSLSTASCNSYCSPQKHEQLLSNWCHDTFCNTLLLD